MIPPSQVNGRPYQATHFLPGRGALDWTAAARVLEPAREHPARKPRHPPPTGRTEQRIEALARWVAAQREGNRNSGLFWAANRALETDPAADLSPLAAAARQAGLDDPETTRTLQSARRTTQARPASRPPTASPKEPADDLTTPRRTAPPPRQPKPLRPGHPAQHRRDSGSDRRRPRPDPAAARRGRHLPLHRRRRRARPRHRPRPRLRPPAPTPATSRALAAVTSASLRRARVDAGGTRLRLRALHVMGHGSARIARALGIREMTIRAIVRGDAATVSTSPPRPGHRPLRHLVGQARPRAHPRRARRRHHCPPPGHPRQLVRRRRPRRRPARHPRLQAPQPWKPATGTGIAPDINPSASPEGRHPWQ